MLGWDYSDWSGAAIYEMLTPTERKNYKVSKCNLRSKNRYTLKIFKEGKLTWGSLNLLADKPAENTRPDITDEVLQ